MLLNESDKKILEWWGIGGVRLDGMIKNMNIQDSIRAELDATRTIFHSLLDSLTEADMHKQSLNPGWTNGEILAHNDLRLSDHQCAFAHGAPVGAITERFVQTICLVVECGHRSIQLGQCPGCARTGQGLHLSARWENI